MLYLVTRDSEGAEQFERIRFGMKLQEKQPEIYRAMFDVMAGGAKTVVSRLLNADKTLTEQFEAGLWDQPYAIRCTILADRFRGIMYSVKFTYIKTVSLEEDQRHVLQFGISSNKRDGKYVELACIFTPKEKDV